MSVAISRRDRSSAARSGTLALSLRKSEVAAMQCTASPLPNLWRFSSAPDATSKKWRWPPNVPTTSFVSAPREMKITDVIGPAAMKLATSRPSRRDQTLATLLVPPAA
jgi:hypothetical protein